MRKEEILMGMAGGRGRATRLAAALAAAFAALLWAHSVSAHAACPNEAFRTGKSAHLPDCRAYELVTPPANIYLGEKQSIAKTNNLFPTEAIRASGDSAIFYDEEGSLGDPSGGHAKHDGYQAVRTADGWRTVRLLTPTPSEARQTSAGGISADHQYTFYNAGFGTVSEPFPLEEEGVATYLGNPNGTFEPLAVGSLGQMRTAFGHYISPGGAHIIFNGACLSTGSACEIVPLEPDAPPAGTVAIYDRAPDGPTKVVSLLPGNVTPAAGEDAAYQGVSADGSVVVFRIGSVDYARVDDATTLEVASSEPIFGGVSADGTYVFYLQAGNVYSLDTSTGAHELVTDAGDAELVNVSADGSHVYFVSHGVIAAGPTGGSQPTEGEPNLYVWSRGGGIAFVATLSPADVSGEPSLTAWTKVVGPWPNGGIAQSFGPGADSSRSTPDGSVLAFESSAQLTSYPNEGHQEVYRYDAGSGAIGCVSCDPSGAPASFDARFEAVNIYEEEKNPIEAQAVVYNLSEDGSRVFFETEEALSGEDVDGINDVYEWSDSTGSPQVSLITSGRTPNYVGGIPGFFEIPGETNNILGITPSGNDVMVGSWESLAEGSSPEGVQSIYDARVGGGFAKPLAEPCSGEACQQLALVAPSLNGPQSEVFHGHGNVVKRRCHRARSGGRRPSQRKVSCRRHRRHRKRHRNHQKGRRTVRAAHRVTTKIGGGK
jgi:hypothetical protein